MGMVWVARLADDGEVASIRANPDGAYDFIQPEEGWETAPIIDLDKEWHAIHFLLTQSAGPTNDPLSLILGDFEEIGEDNGYGPVFYIPNQSLKAFSNMAKALSESELKKRYDTQAMVEQQIYLGEMYHEEGEEGLNFLTQRLDELKEFAAKAASGDLSAFAVIT
ncbi:YfbM family protein [Parerythrobacter jejuensis]|uniref:DUF1877 family protein n=1 Tax=Parerythrobacter jejuensis TaxID=795812 RepID=A0A845AV74_9SPHN|nr:YfbM family protein [Parerythrobacter jejuensis]MXP32711.1 DUF1877 family protein [Parerythrobacter jejuensis]